MTALLMGYFYFFAPKPPEPQPQQPADTTLVLQDSQQPQAAGQPAVPDSLRQRELQDKYSDLYPAATGASDTVTVRTDKLTLRIDTRGGTIREAYLNEYQTFDSLPLPIVAPDPANAFYFEFPFNNRAIRSSELTFTPSKTEIALSGDAVDSLSLKIPLDADRYLEQIYFFTGNTYDLRYEIRMHGLGNALGAAPAYDLIWISNLPKTEMALQNMRQKTTIAYRVGDDVEKLKENDETQRKKLAAQLKWVSYKSQFFSHILMADQDFRTGSIAMSTPQTDRVNRYMESQLTVDLPRAQTVASKYRMYLGPNEFTTLRSYKQDLEDQMDLGWSFVAWINKGTTYVFKFLEQYVPNYGVIIIILAVLIRLLMLPLSYMSYISMAKMRIVNGLPEVKAVDEKHKDNPQQASVVKMGMYREYGASPFGGCLPLLISYPFLIALFFFFPQSVELRQQSFLWAHDLSTYDSILDLPFTIPAYGSHVSLFTILMAISTFVYTYFQQQSQPTTAATAQFKTISYIMPFFLLFFLNSYSAGLSLYYFMSNILSMLQNWIIKLFISDDKLLAGMRAKQQTLKKAAAAAGKGGAAPKGRLEGWLESQQKKQQELMRMRQQQAAPNRRGRRSGK